MIFTFLLLKIIPLYFLILLGYLAGRFFNAHRDTLAQILFFLITPVILFNGVVHTRLDLNVVALPLFTFTISSCLCFCFYRLSALIWNDSTKNLMAMSAGCGNTGYLGFPLALLFFDEQGAGVYIMAWLGMSIFENTLGYYILAKANNTGNECLKKLYKLPSLYAVLIGIVCNYAGLIPPGIFDETISHMKGAFTVLGMMMIGMGLAHLPHFKFDFKFIGVSFLAKFAAWPLFMLLLIAVDTHWLHFFDKTIYDALFLISIVPIGVNTVILSALLKNKPEKAVVAVVASTLFALAYIPFMTGHFLDDPTVSEQSEIADAAPDEEH
jgi:predicted permease